MFGGGFNVNVQLPNILPQVHISSSVYLSSGMCISLRSHHGKYLRADSNLSVNQAPHCQEWERWHVEQHGNHIALRSHHGKYLRADSNKTVNQAPHCQEWERWHIEYKGNQVTLRSHHHTYLRADSNGSVNLTHDCREWEHWTVEVHGGNTSYQQPQYQQQQYQQPQYQQPQYQQPQYQQPQYQQPQYQQQYQQPQYGQQMPGMPGMNDQYPSTQYQMPGMNTQYTPQYESPQSLIGRRFFLQSQLGPVAHVHGGNAHNGAKITLWDKNTHGHQSNLHWTLSYAQNGAFYIESCVDQNFVLHQHGATHDNGGEITLWDKRTHGHQGNVQVNFQNVGGEWWIIKFVHSGKCVHVHGGATANGTPCTQWDYVDQSNLKWKFVPL